MHFLKIVRNAWHKTEFRNELKKNSDAIQMRNIFDRPIKLQNLMDLSIL